MAHLRSDRPPLSRHGRVLPAGSSRVRRYSDPSSPARRRCREFDAGSLVLDLGSGPGRSHRLCPPRRHVTAIESRAAHLAALASARGGGGVPRRDDRGQLLRSPAWPGAPSLVTLGGPSDWLSRADAAALDPIIVRGGALAPVRRQADCDPRGEWPALLGRWARSSPARPQSGARGSRPRRPPSGVAPLRVRVPRAARRDRGAPTERG